MAYPYLLSFAKCGNHNRFEYILGTLAARGKLQAAAEGYGVGSLALSLTSRRAYPLGIARLARWLARHEIDVLQTHLFDSCAVGMTAARLAGVTCAIFTAHHVSEWEVARLGSPRAGALDRFVRIRLADHVVAPSDSIGRVLMASDGRADASLTAIPHGIDLDGFAAIRRTRARTRAALGMERSTVFGAIGRLSPVKNYPVLIRAFAQVASEDPSLTLVVIGQGSAGPLLELASSLGIRGQVRFVGWHEEIRHLLSAFDVFVHAALAETFGLVLVEALAAGLPVVSTSVGVAPELIENGVTGQLLSGTDEAAIVAGLETILAQRDRWESMGVAAQARIRPYSQNRMVTAHEALYERLLGSAR